MARLNTISLPKPEESRLFLSSQLESKPVYIQESRASALGIISMEKHERAVGTTHLESPLQRSRSQRSCTTSGSCFDIFHDADESDFIGDDGGHLSERSCGGDCSGKATLKAPLRLTKTNSLLLAVPQQARSWPSRKSEVDYDKENDLGEREAEEPDSTRRSYRLTPIGARRGQQLQRLSDHYVSNKSETDSGDTAFDSMDDFIVSDNDELSYYATSETEERHTTTPPPPTRRRLFRGRRPELMAGVERDQGRPLQQEALSLETLAPAASEITPLMSEPRQREVFQGAHDTDKEVNLPTPSSSDASPKKGDAHLITDDSELDQQLDSGQEIQLKSPRSSLPRRRVLSPTKRRLKIPALPYRESADAFWSQEFISDWVNQYSPCKLEQLVLDFEDSDGGASDSMLRFAERQKHETKPISKAAVKRAEAERKKAQLARKKSFDDKKIFIAEDFLKALDDAATGGQIQRMAEETGGVKIIWSKTLQKTAGRANWKRDRTVHPATATAAAQPRELAKHHAFIELAERIIDDEHRLINTLAHEYCHLANFMISGVHNNPHGTSFKQWAHKCKDALMSHPTYGGRVEVTTKHSYTIDYKYVWNCTTCGQTYGRHSKSIDTIRMRCSVCRGCLQQIKPKPRNVSPKKQQCEKEAVDSIANGLGGVALHN